MSVFRFSCLSSLVRRGWQLSGRGTECRGQVWRSHCGEGLFVSPVWVTPLPPPPLALRGPEPGAAQAPSAPWRRRRGGTRSRAGGVSSSESSGLSRPELEREGACVLEVTSLAAQGTEVLQNCICGGDSEVETQSPPTPQASGPSAWCFHTPKGSCSRLWDLLSTQKRSAAGRVFQD